MQSWVSQLWTPYFQAREADKTDEELYHQLKADAKNGGKNGLEIIVDAEQFNHAQYSKSIGSGFLISLHHHLDKPMMKFSSKLIYTGTATMVNLKPTISYTTDEAIRTFRPHERGCYTDGEANLTYLSYKDGYRYQINNCLIDQLMRDIIWHCKCMPYFDDNDHHEYLEIIPWCSGQKLYCANEKIESVTLEKTNHRTDLEITDKIGNITKPPSIRCLPDCKTQENNNEMSFAKYPQKSNFFFQETFCDVASHIRKRTCLKEDKKYFMDKQQPNLCPIIKAFKKYIGQASMCKKWPDNYMKRNDYKINETLKEELYHYARNNLAYIQVMIQSPYITRIKRDVAMTITSYVANAGGLMGLCLGFSFISCIEMIFWFCCCCQEFKKSFRIRP